jgi:hypothetical protein
MEPRDLVPRRAFDPRRGWARLGYVLLIGWWVAVFGLFIFSIWYQPQPAGVWDLMIVVAAALLVPLFVFAIWRLLARLFSGFGT